MLQLKDIAWLNGYKNMYTFCCLQETHFRPKDTYRLKVRGWKIYIPCKWEAKESWSGNPHIRKHTP